MEIPDFRRGEQLTARKLNKLADEVRLTRLLSGPGYTLTQTPGGTVLNIQQQTTSGGGTAADVVCNFKVTDATEKESTGLKVAIQSDKVNGRYPQGMNAEDRFILDLDDRIENWCAVYLVLKVDEFGDIRPEENAITLTIATDWMPNANAPGNQTQYIFIASINLETAAGGSKFIASIENACPTNLAAHPIGDCPFELDLAASVGDPYTTIVIRTGTVTDPTGVQQPRYPAGMAKGVRYELPMPNEGNWFAIYMILALDYKGDILSGENSITFSVETDYIDSTASYQYVLLGEVTVTDDNEAFPPRYISYIQNYCNKPIPTGLSNCRWEILRADDTKIRIRNASVNGKYPAGMTAQTEYEMDVPLDQDWHALYAIMVLLDDGSVDTSPSGLTFSLEIDYKQNDGNIIYFLVGEVVTSEIEGGGRKITWIHNECPYVFPPGGGGSGSCPFKVTDASIIEPGGETLNLRVEIAYGLVANRVPDGMVLGTPFIITFLPSGGIEEDKVFYFWCVLEYDPDTLQLIGESTAITFLGTDELKTNTPTKEYVLIAAVQTKATGGPGDGPYIKLINSICGTVSPNPCNLGWSNQANLP